MRPAAEHEQVLLSKQALPNGTGFAIFVGQTERPQAQWEIPQFRSQLAQPVPIRSCWGHHLPKPQPHPGSLHRGFHPLPPPFGVQDKPAGKVALTFAVDLPVFVCQGGRLQAFATLGTAEAGLVPGLWDRSRAWLDNTRGQGRNALAAKWGHFSVSDPKQLAKKSERDESFSLE